MNKLIKIIKIVRSYILWHLCFGQKRKHYKQKCKRLLEEVFNRQNIIKNRKKALSYIQNNKSDSLFVIGDSHTEIFHLNDYVGKKKILGDVHHETQLWFNYSKHFICYHLDAVTAYNTNNENATIPSLTKINFLIENGFLPKGCTIICSFGEIDCRVHIQKQSEKQNRPVEYIIDDVLKNYETLLLMLKNKGYHVIAYGPIPSQSDKIPVDSNFPRYGTQLERNNITKIFNEKLKALCEKDGLEYKTLFYDLLNEDMSTKEEYISYVDHVHLGTQSFYLLEKMFIKKDNQKIAETAILFEKIPAHKKDIYVLTYNSGEVFTFLELLRSTKNYPECVKNSLLLATKPYHIDLIEMVCPEMEYIFIPQAEALTQCDEQVFSTHNKNIHIVFPKYFADSCHPLWLNQDLKVHYFDKIREISNLDGDLSGQLKLTFDDATKSKLTEKIKTNNLKEKFIFIAPEALTVQPISVEFWKMLYDKLSKKGFDVFWNFTKTKFNFGKTFDLSLKEANLLARKAKGIISLRSGLSEQLATVSDVPIVTLYTNSLSHLEPPMILASRFREISSLKKYPYTSDNIYEFDAVQADESLADKIVQIITQERS